MGDVNPSHCRGGETEDQRGQATCPKSHSQEGAEPQLKARFADVRFHPVPDTAGSLCPRRFAWCSSGTVAGLQGPPRGISSGPHLSGLLRNEAHHERGALPSLAEAGVVHPGPARLAVSVTAYLGPGKMCG